MVSSLFVNNLLGSLYFCRGHPVSTPYNILNQTMLGSRRILIGERNKTANFKRDKHPIFIQNRTKQSILEQYKIADWQK